MAMPGIQMDHLNEVFLQAYNEGNFLRVVYQTCLEGKDTRTKVADALTQLNNTGLIDVISEFCKLTNNSTTHDFFLTRHVFEEALPSINSAVEPVMLCVQHLHKAAGKDMAAGSIITSFIRLFPNLSKVNVAQIAILAVSDVVPRVYGIC